MRGNGVQVGETAGFLVTEAGSGELEAQELWKEGEILKLDLAEKQRLERPWCKFSKGEGR